MLVTSTESGNSSSRTPEKTPMLTEAMRPPRRTDGPVVCQGDVADRAALSSHGQCRPFVDIGTTPIGRRLRWMSLDRPFYQRRKYDLSSQRPSWGLVGSAGKGIEGASGRLVPNRGLGTIEIALPTLEPCGDAAGDARAGGPRRSRN